MGFFVGIYWKEGSLSLFLHPFLQGLGAVWKTRFEVVANVVERLVGGSRAGK